MNQEKDADYSGMPRWVKVTGLVAALLVLVVVVILIVGSGEHGPGMHGGSGQQTPPTSMPEDSGAEPGGDHT